MILSQDLALVERGRAFPDTRYAWTEAGEQIAGKMPAMKSWRSCAREAVAAWFIRSI